MYNYSLIKRCAIRNNLLCYKQLPIRGHLLFVISYLLFARGARYTIPSKNSIVFDASVSLTTAFFQSLL
jgi:hypothetical protein